MDLHRKFSFSFFGIDGWSIDLDYYDTEWFALEMNRDHSVVFETEPKNCILDYFVDFFKGILAHSSRYNGLS